MQLIHDHLYHLYNQGNNRTKIFYKKENYEFFLQKFRKYVLPYAKVLSYCLMPNHFHFLLYTSELSIILKKIGGLYVTNLAEGFRQLLSSYSQAINKQESRTGSLFRQKTKAKLLDNGDEDYPLTCFHYHHQNPVMAGLVHKLEDWEYSSFREYLKGGKDSLCDIKLAHKLLDISKKHFYEESYLMIDPEKIKKIF